MIDPNVIDAMLAAGCTAEQIAAVVKADARAESEKVAARREADRIRKRRQRESEKATGTMIASALSRGQTGTDRDAVDTPPSPKEIPQTPKEIPPTTQKEKTPKGVQKKGSRLPSDFKPDIEFAIGLGLPRSQAEAEAAKFCDYWTAKAGQGATKQDWKATWRVWARTAKERLPGARAGPMERPGRPDHFKNYASELNGQERDDRGGGGHRDDAQGIPLRTIEHHG